MSLQNIKHLNNLSLEELKEKIYTLGWKKNFLSKLKGELGLLIKTKEGNLKIKISSHNIKEVDSFEENLIYLEINQKDLSKLLSNPSLVTQFLLSGKIKIRGDSKKFFEIIGKI